MTRLSLLSLAIPPLSFTVEGGQSNSFVVYGSALAALVALVWAVCERSERRASQRQNAELSLAFRQVIEQHYRERLQAEDRHLLAHDSSVRTILGHLERTVLGKPQP